MLDLTGADALELVRVSELGTLSAPRLLDANFLDVNGKAQKQIAVRMDLISARSCSLMLRRIMTTKALSGRVRLPRMMFISLALNAGQARDRACIRAGQ